MPTDLPDYTRMMGVNVLIEEPEVGPVNIARYQADPGDLTDGDRAPLLADIKGRAIIEVIQDEAGDLHVTVTPADDAEFTVVQDTAESLQATVTPEESAVFPVSQDTAEDLQAEATPRPKGGVIAKASAATGAAFATIGSHTPAAGVTFQLAKILVSCPEDVMYRLRWNGTVIGAEVYVTGGIPFTDWFPMDYYAMAGDAAKIFDVRVMYPTGGATATCHVEIVGEDVGA